MRISARAVVDEILDIGPGGTHQARLERDVRVNVTAQRLAQLRVAETGLVFGRTDHDDGSTRHIGRLAIDDDAHDPLVVDWRAPAAEPFYRATGRDPMGVVRRRHLVVTGRRVVDLDDELLGDATAASDDLVLMGGASLLAALGRARTGRMGDIVATIQSEQDQVIRAPLPGVLVVQGGPGTGKTVIALHRAAYLLYTHRFPLERAGVLLIGPNQVHLRYIEAVLPALGEDTVTLATPANLGPVAVTATDGPLASRVKGEARMAQVITKAVRDRQRALTEPTSVMWRGERLRLSPRASKHIIGVAQRRPGTHNQRRRLVERLVVRHLQNLSAEVDEAVLGERAMVEALERMWPVLSAEELLHDLFGSPALVTLAAADLFSSDERSALVRPRCPRVGDVAWTEADIALLDEAAGSLGQPPAGPRRVAHQEWSRTWGHILIDEAQDLSPMQLRMLGRHCPGGSMTIAGDLAQASGPWGPSSWDEILAHLPSRRPARRVDLTINYRTPAEIMQLAAAVLAVAWPGFRPSQALRQSGQAPVFTTTDAVGLPAAVSAAVAAERAAIGTGTLAVIVPHDLLAAVRQVLPGAGEGPRLLDAEVALLTTNEAKGLEFDTVVVVEPAAIVAESPQGARALYLALTRSTRRLHVVHTQALPPGLNPPDPASSNGGARVGAP